MDFWLWLLYFLSVSGARRILPEVKLEGMLGGSIIIKCPLPKMPIRVYLCREKAESPGCNTVVSSKNFVRKEYMHRMTLHLCPDENLFLVEMTELAKNDSGVYACGTGLNTDRGKTQKVTLAVHSDYGPFWEEEPLHEMHPWFPPLPPWFQDPAHDNPFEAIPEVTTSAPQTEAPPTHRSSPTTSVTHHPPVYRSSSSVEAAKPTLPSTTESKTSAPKGLLRSQTASFNHHTKLYRHRAFDRGTLPGLESQGFHILIPTVLGLILLTFLGLVVKKFILKKKALSRRIRRLAVRMTALEASQRSALRRPRGAPRPRSQNNIYSAYPRRDRGAPAAGERAGGGGEREAPVRSPGPSAPAAPPQVAEALWPHVPSLKTSCEYINCGIYHQPAAKVEDSDSDDYVNLSCLTHPSTCPPGPRPWCQ